MKRFFKRVYQLIKQLFGSDDFLTEAKAVVQFVENLADKTADLAEILGSKYAPYLVDIAERISQIGGTIEEAILYIRELLDDSKTDKGALMRQIAAYILAKLLKIEKQRHVNLLVEAAVNEISRAD